MAIKKSDRKWLYSEVLHLMLQGKNKEAFDRLKLMCAEDVGVYLLTDYDSVIEDREVAMSPNDAIITIKGRV